MNGDRSAALTAEGVLVDLDGTVYAQERLLPGAAEAIGSLRRAGVPLAFVTNTTRRPRRALVERLGRLGIEVTAGELLTAPVAAARWLAAEGVERVGFFLPAETREDFSGFDLDGAEPEAVLVGDLGAGWSFERLNHAFRQLLAGARLVAVQKNRYQEGADGLVLDAGAFVAALEYAAGVRATVVGKPSRAFFETAARAVGVPLERLVMVGDDVEGDVGGAREAGAAGVLVRTGKFRESALETSPVRPDAILDSLAELPRLLGLEGR